MSAEQGPTPSIFVQALANAIDTTEMVYALQYQALAVFFADAAKRPGVDLVFNVPGSYAPFRGPMAYKDMCRLSATTLQSAVLQGALFLTGSVEAFMRDLAMKAYRFRAKNAVDLIDNSWFQLDLLKDICGVDPRECICFSAVSKATKIAEAVRYHWAPIEEVNQEDFYTMCLGLKNFAGDFERAVLFENKGLKLEGSK